MEGIMGLIVEQAIRHGVPAALKIISAWSMDGDEITEADILALKGALKDPENYFRKASPAGGA